jgi:hypothetical protein
MSDKLEEFLRLLISENDKSMLSEGMVNSLGELFIKYEMEKRGKDISTFMTDEKEEMKYYTLGWYLYNQMGNKEQN